MIPYRRSLIAVVLASVLLAAGCSSGSSSAESTPSTAPVSSAGTASPAGAESAGAAVTALLEAERTGDHEASYRFISTVGREKYKDAAEWAALRNGLPAVTGFEVGKTTDDAVETIVEHEPGIDPFVGIRLARERQTWTVREGSSGWTVNPEPTIEGILPAREQARDVAQRWAAAIQKCDPAAAAELQAVERPYGSSNGADQLCRSRGTLRPSKVSDAPAGPGTAELVAQFGSGVLGAAVATTVEGGPEPVHIVLVPIGDAWRVIATFDS